MGRKPKKNRSLTNLDTQRPRAASSEAVGRRDGQTIDLEHWIFAVALVLAVLFIYQPVWHGGFLWDDDLHLLNNPVLRPGGLAKVWVPGGYLNYWPLTFTAYWLQFKIWGLNTFGFHIVNIVLHGISAVLVWQILVQLRVRGAMFAAAIFALHPVNVESVAWIAQLKGILSLMLALLSTLLYLQYEQRGGRWRFASAIGAFLLSTLAKGAALTLPIVLLALAWWQRGRIGWRDLLHVLPYVLIGIVMTGSELLTHYPLTEADVSRSDSFLGRAAVAGCAVWFYLWKLIWPLNLTFVYPRWQIDDRNVLSYLPGVLLVIILMLAWWQRRSWGRVVVMLIVCYVALLLPILGFASIYFMKYSLVADHYQYAAMIVPCAVFAGVAAALGRWERWGRPAVYCACGIPLVILGTLTWQHCHMYADIETLYNVAIARNPDCWMTHNNLGGILIVHGQIDEAIAHFRRSLEINPDNADAYNNLGTILADRGQTAKAIAHYQKALEITPEFAEAHNNFATVLGQQGRFSEAIYHYQKALEINPDYAEAHNNLATVFQQQGRFSEAIDHYQKALKIKPDYAQAHNNLGNILADRGRIAEAIDHYKKSLESSRSDAAAHNKLAAVLGQQGRFAEAIDYYRKALKIKPDYADACNNLAWLLATCPIASVRNGAEAVALAERAAKLSARREPAILGTLAAAYADAGRFSEAVETAQKAIDLATQQNKTALAESIKTKIRLYAAKKPFRDVSGR